MYLFDSHIKYYKIPLFYYFIYNLIHIMEANIIKQAIKQLPPQERVVAIALKNIYDQIKELNKEEQTQIDANHLSFISKFKILQKKAANIIQGTLLKEEDMDNSDQFFNQSEQKQRKQQMAKKQKIQDFWLNTIANSTYGQMLTEFDKQLLKHITNIETTITTDTLEFLLNFQQNPYLEKAILSRRLLLDNGIPSKFEGDEPNWKNKKQLEDSFCGTILINTDDNQKLLNVMDIVGNLINQIIPYSLQYFLGAIEIGEEQQEGEQDQDEEQN